uniref:Sushi domain-containing protein n=1 Tax=Sparus aurata TaxID=8175 RepID=A0A671UM36_SPAAU
MCLRHLGFVLLLWFRGGLHAQSAKKLCAAPRLPDGYFVPEQATYAHETKLTYACEKGYKPAVEGWWATSTCQSGTWSPKPQCINQTACTPPTIPNAKYAENPYGWYKEGDKIWVTCDEAYELKNKHATALCKNGSWSSVPVCERSVDACGAPPKVPHTVIVDHRHQELFAADTALQYECEDGYTAEGAGNDKTIVCIKGAWTKGPTCNQTACTPPTIPNAKYTENPYGWYEEGDKIKVTCDEAYELKTRDTTALCKNGTWISVPVCERSVDACGAPPKVRHAVIVDHRHQELFAADTELQYECEDGYTAEGAGNDKTIVCIEGAWTKGPTCSRVTDGSSVTGGGDTTSAGSWTPPAGGGSSSSSGSNTGDTERHLTTIDKCGKPHKIPKAVIVRTFRRSVKYRCQDYHKRLGPEYVRCYSDGTWSELPTCQASYCVVNTFEYPDLKPAGEIHVLDGDTERLECVDKMEWWFNNYSDGQCNNGIIHLSRCCTKAQLAIVSITPESTFRKKNMC